MHRNESKIDTQVYQEHLNYNQSTHKRVVNSSVAAALVHLKKHYFGDQTVRHMYLRNEVLRMDHLDTERKVDSLELTTHFGPVIEEKIDDTLFQTPADDYLDKVIVEMLSQPCLTSEEKEAIDYIHNNCKEKVDMALDRVSIYLPTQDSTCEENFKDICEIIPLKYTLILVWKALQDDAKFMRDLQGTEAEKLALAVADKPNRIKSFFNTLIEIKKNKVCHTGNRHELVFLLNEAYQDFEFFEDEKATVMNFLREFLNEKFWQLYQATTDAAEKKKLNQNILTWIEEGDATAIYQRVNTENQVEKTLHALFIKNGCNPVTYKVNELIQEYLTILYFVVDPKAYPGLNKVAKILNMEPSEEKQASNQALGKVKEWIRNDLDSAQQGQQIEEFYLIYSTHLDWNKYKLLFEIAGIITDNITILPDRLEQYFLSFAADHFPQIPEPTRSLINNFNELKNKESRLIDNIENFFAEWFWAMKSVSFDSAASFLKRHYQMLIDPVIQSRILLYDNKLQEMMERNREDNIINVTPYMINRVFLQAIIVDKPEWTELFKTVFDGTLAFVVRNFDTSPQGVNQVLKRDSYPEELIAYLTYLKEGGEKKDSFGLLLPHKITTSKEWIMLVNFIGLKAAACYYQQHEARLLMQFIEGRFTPWFLETYIPRNNWMNILDKLNPYWMENYFLRQISSDLLVELLMDSRFQIIIKNMSLINTVIEKSNLRERLTNSTNKKYQFQVAKIYYELQPDYESAEIIAKHYSTGIEEFLVKDLIEARSWFFKSLESVSLHQLNDYRKWEIYHDLRGQLDTEEVVLFDRQLEDLTVTLFIEKFFDEMRSDFRLFYNVFSPATLRASFSDEKLKELASRDLVNKPLTKFEINQFLLYVLIQDLGNSSCSFFKFVMTVINASLGVVDFDAVQSIRFLLEMISLKRGFSEANVFNAGPIEQKQSKLLIPNNPILLHPANVNIFCEGVKLALTDIFSHRHGEVSDMLEKTAKQLEIASLENEAMQVYQLSANLKLTANNVIFFTKYYLQNPDAKNIAKVVNLLLKTPVTKIFSSSEVDRFIKLFADMPIIPSELLPLLTQYAFMSAILKPEHLMFVKKLFAGTYAPNKVDMPETVKDFLIKLPLKIQVVITYRDNFINNCEQLYHQFFCKNNALDNDLIDFIRKSNYADEIAESLMERMKVGAVAPSLETRFLYAGLVLEIYPCAATALFYKCYARDLNPDVYDNLIWSFLVSYLDQPFQVTRWTSAIHDTGDSHFNGRSASVPTILEFINLSHIISNTAASYNKSLLDDVPRAIGKLFEAYNQSKRETIVMKLVSHRYFRPFVQICKVQLLQAISESRHYWDDFLKKLTHNGESELTGSDIDSFLKVIPDKNKYFFMNILSFNAANLIEYYILKDEINSLCLKLASFQGICEAITYASNLQKTATVNLLLEKLLNDELNKIPLVSPNEVNDLVFGLTNIVDKNNHLPNSEKFMPFLTDISTAMQTFNSSTSLLFEKIIKAKIKSLLNPVEQTKFYNNRSLSFFKHSLSGHYENLFLKNGLVISFTRAGWHAVTLCDFHDLKPLTEIPYKVIPTACNPRMIELSNGKILSAGWNTLELLEIKEKNIHLVKKYELGERQLIGFVPLSNTIVATADGLTIKVYDLSQPNLEPLKIFPFTDFRAFIRLENGFGVVQESSSRLFDAELNITEHLYPKHAKFFSDGRYLTSVSTNDSNFRADNLQVSIFETDNKIKNAFEIKYGKYAIILEHGYLAVVCYRPNNMEVKIFHRDTKDPQQEATFPLHCEDKDKLTYLCNRWVKENGLAVAASGNEAFQVLSPNLGR